jgi:hypothetical protein
MTEKKRRNWRELCRAGLEAKHSDELVQIV